MVDCLRKSIEERVCSVEVCFVFEAKIECDRVVYWFFDKWLGFQQFLVKGSSEG